jgi:hypothetical protein
MANTVVGVEIKVKGDQANQSVGSFKKQLKEAQAELVALTSKFGVTSKEAGEAAKRVADLKDTLGDAKALSDAFNPGNKFQALSSAIQGATSAFTALQGAQALFGSESEKVQETLAKVQGALAFSQGISGVLDLADNFKNLAAVVKGGLTTAFGTLRNAIISTGIGALAVGIGLLIANFDKVKQAIINLIPGAEGFFNVLGDIVDTVTGWFGASEDVLDTQKALKEATDQLNDSLADYEGQIDRVVKIEKLRAQIAGQSQAQIDKLEQAGILAKINNYDRLIEKARKNFIDTTALEQKRLAAQEQLFTLGLQAEAKAADQSRALQAKRSEEAKKRREDDEKQAQAARDAITKQNTEFVVGIRNTNRSILADTKSVLSEQTAATKEALNTQAADTLRNTEFAIEVRREEQRIKAEFDQAEIDSKRATVAAVASATDAIAEVIGKNTAVGKALSIASATISTFEAGIDAFKAIKTAKTPVEVISAIALSAKVIAQGIGIVKRIRSVQIPRAGAGGGGGAIPSLQPLTPAAQTTTLDQSSINQIGAASSRAFVLERDVTNNQERVARLNRAARIN